MKSKLVSLKDKFIEETIKAIFMLLLYLFYNNNLYTEKDFFTKIRDSSAIIIPYIIYIFIISIYSIFKRPLVTNIKMKNFLIGDKEETILYHFKDFREDASKIVLSLEVKENNSLWVSLAKWIFKNNKFSLKIALEPLDDQFICEPCMYTDEIDFQGAFFTIDISDIIFSNLEHNVPSVIDYEFIIKENKDNPPMNKCRCVIKPILCIDNKSLKFFHKLFVKFNLDLKNGYYSINFVR
ncbi:MAG: hypothetical protein E7206_16245 [Clostridium beijerinckii]|nr:hypothetical protein [Clostridium beijerinckii]